ncbi:response regulator [Sphingomonas glacialis]|uniref:Response regulator n=1 Tax=Sphingomonas glacialis TaxID=658225 RepID=A0A502FAV2_9SPHN|nr:response regulator [Sphingomonas glacialis]TPG46558.1 response regulator [Sphingomonas glacialis]
MLILTVDDSDIILDILEDALLEAGHRTARAGDGVEAIEWLGHHRADVITTDRNMPRMDGFSLLETLANRHDLGEPPIIVISSLNDTASLDQAMAAGATDWFVKPFDPQKLIERIATLATEVPIASGPLS